jgi:glycosyltransferase involved in cell wall biosynthesis
MDKSNIKLSVIIIVKNESLHIARCLESVVWADEIIVLDSGSTDNTIEICERYTRRVYSTDWQGFGVQKQRALDKAIGYWVLSIDADEQVTADLKSEIQQVIKKSQSDGFEIPRLSSYCGRNIKHAGWWPDYVLRLFKRESGTFSPDLVHERVIVNGRIAQLKHSLLHEAFINSDEVLTKVNNYSTLGAKKLHDLGEASSLKKAILKGSWMFFRTYILKLGFLDGKQGLMLAISSAEVTYYKYVKLMQLQ